MQSICPVSLLVETFCFPRFVILFAFKLPVVYLWNVSLKQACFIVHQINNDLAMFSSPTFSIKSSWIVHCTFKSCKFFFSSNRYNKEFLPASYHAWVSTQSNKPYINPDAQIPPNAKLYSTPFWPLNLDLATKVSMNL